jgi:hypothetical protein
MVGRHPISTWSYLRSQISLYNQQNRLRSTTPTFLQPPPSHLIQRARKQVQHVPLRHELLREPLVKLDRLVVVRGGVLVKVLVRPHRLRQLLGNNCPRALGCRPPHEGENARPGARDARPEEARSYAQSGPGAPGGAAVGRAGKRVLLELLQNLQEGKIVG